jgi:hypothetical protein
LCTLLLFEAQSWTAGLHKPIRDTMPPAFGIPTRRLRVKTKFVKPKQVPLTKIDDWALEEQDGSRRQVYLVTFPHPKSSHSKCGRLLVAPGTLTKRQILEKLLDACQKPIYSDGRSLAQQREVHLKHTGIWREYHAPDPTGTAHAHDHAPILAQPKRQFGFLPVKKALLARHGLATHWSCTHNGYWSAIRYVSVCSEKKPEGTLDLEPELWSFDGEHPPLHTCRDEPLTAAALRRRGEVKYQKAAGDGKREKITELDVWPIVVENGFRNGPDEHTAHLKLVAHAKKHCSSAMQTFLFKRRHLLPGLIESIWQWETVDAALEDATRSRMETLVAAASGPCVCGGSWPAAVAESVIENQIPLQELCSDVVSALRQGRSETTPVIVLAGARGGEGKSFFLKPLLPLFGDDNVFPCPEPGTFPLLDLPGKKVVFLDDWRFNKAVLPFETQCRWYDGSQVRVQRPQNQNGVTGHVVYKGTAPIFATTKLADMARLEKLSVVDPTTGLPQDAGASMIHRRLKVYKFNTRIAKPASKMIYCPACFAQLLLRQSEC